MRDGPTRKALLEEFRLYAEEEAEILALLQNSPVGDQPGDTLGPEGDLPGDTPGSEGDLPGPAEGDLPGPAEGDLPGPAEDDLPRPAEPKKKRTYLRDLTPNSKERELERRKQAKRDNSSKWHSTWVSKGIKKNVDESDEGGEPSASAAAPAAPSAAPVPPKPDEPEEGGVFKPDDELLLEAVSSDMRSVRAQFMKKWSQWKEKMNPEIDPETVRTMSGKAWMESELRGQIMATRKHQQY